jgi:carbamoyl-phosphate synthase large subunit
MKHLAEHTGEREMMKKVKKRKMNVLITTASGRRVRLINAFREALDATGGGKVITTDSNPLSPGFFMGDNYYVLPRSSSRDHIPALLRICRKEKIDVIIPTTDMDLVVLSENEEKFRRAGAEVIVSDKKTIALCNDKLKTWRFFVKNNIPVPRSYSADELRKGSAVSYPVFIKPRSGAGTRDCYVAGSRSELEFHKQYVKNPFVQEHVQGREFTIDTFSDMEGNVISAVPRERIEVRAGVSDKGRTIMDRRLINFGKTIAERLRIKGPACMQCIYDGNEFKFIEINPRFSGGISLTIAAGVHVPLLLLRSIMGERIEPAIGKFKKDLLMLVYEEAVYVDSSGRKLLS